MEKNEKIKIRLNERLRVYQDSGGCTATYADIAHIVEDIIEILDDDKELIGFRGEVPQGDKRLDSDNRE